MILIVCDQHCKHQKEGYCTLNQISNLTSQSGAKCGYFSSSATVQKADAVIREDTSAPYYADRL